MLEQHTNLKIEKEKLCEERVQLAKNTKSNPWTLEELEAVLKHLKRNKSRDPNGYANKIFKPEVAGDYLKLALLKLMNRVKDEQVIPNEFVFCTINCTFKKGKARIFF